MTRVGVVVGVVAALLVGVPAATGSTAWPFIVGGQPADPGEYPAQGYLEIDFGSVSGFCGGTLVGSRHFLTAAHCATDSDDNPLSAASFSVVLGDNDVDPPNTDVYAVTAVDVHESWDGFTFQNDVALLKLDRPAEATARCRAACGQCSA